MTYRIKQTEQGIYCHRFEKKLVHSLNGWYKGEDAEHYFFQSLVIATFCDKITGDIIEKYELNSMYALPKNGIKYELEKGHRYLITKDKISKIL